MFGAQPEEAKGSTVSMILGLRRSTLLMRQDVTRTQDDLQERSRQQDEQIELLLSQFNQLQMNAKVNRWTEQAKQCLNNGGVRGTVHSSIAPINLLIRRT